MHKLALGLSFVGLLGIGCAGKQVTPTAEAGNKALGIASFQVTKTASDVTVVGLDAAKNTLGTLHMTYGAFTMSDDWAEGRTGADRNVTGFNIDLEFGGIKTHHESAGQALDLPRLPGPAFKELQLFIDDPHVYEPLESFGVEFQHGLDVAAAGNEVAYDLSNSQCGGNCGGSPCGGISWGYGAPPTQYCTGASTNACSGNTAHLMTSGTTGDCDNSTYHNQNYVALCCSDSSYNTTNAAIKACVPSANGSTACGTGGSVGCAVCWQTGFGFYNSCGATHYNIGDCNGVDSGVYIAYNYCDYSQNPPYCYY